MASSDHFGESTAEFLTRQFYEWETWGRGWRVWQQPVALEPPFRPFFGHFLPRSLGRNVDDARKPTFFSSLFDRRKALSSGTDDDAEQSEREPEYVEESPAIIEVQVALPSDAKITKDAAGQFLLSLGYVSHPVSFEIVGTHTEIIVQVACVERDRRQVREQLQAFFPDTLLVEREGYLKGLCTDGASLAAVDFGLSKEFMRPLRSYERFEPDPLAGLIGAFSELAHDEFAILQVLFTPARHPWAESIIRAVTIGEGDSFFADDPAMVKLTAEKIATPLFATVIRVAARSPRKSNAWRTMQGIGKSLRQFVDSKSNELIPLSNDEYDDTQHASDVLNRQSLRSGMLLNGDELLSLVHLPSVSVRSPKLKREDRKTKLPPEIASGHRLVLGQCQHAGRTVPVTLSPEHRVRHLYTIGASGTGSRRCSSI